jgi:hypothetical protein
MTGDEQPPDIRPDVRRVEYADGSVRLYPPAEPTTHTRVLACPDHRVAVDLGFNRWLMIDRAGQIGVACGPITRAAVELLPPWPTPTLWLPPAQRTTLADVVSRLENLRTHIGNVGDHREAVIARLDELGDIVRTLQRMIDPSP